MSTATSTSGTVEFAAPGPGSWQLDVTHHGRRPLTGYLRPAYAGAFTDGLITMLERYGLPIAGIRPGFVHGCLYARFVGIGEPETPKRLPPAPALWLAARLHPAMHRRNRAAARAWKERRWRQDVDQWFGSDRGRSVHANLEVQAVDPATLDDRALLEHLDDADANFTAQALAGFESHGGDLVPVGDLLAHCSRWGIEHAAAAALLAGSSPASREVAEILSPVAGTVAAAAPAPASVEEVRALAPAADAAVTRWLDHHGWRLLFSDDLDSITLAESPHLQLRVLLAAAEQHAPAAEPDPAPVRERVPEGDRDLFDSLLAEARYGMRMRDDNVGVRWNWPAGLVRRALLEVGRRLADRGRLHLAEHAVELEPGEARDLLASRAGPDADEVAARLARRMEVEAAGPPDVLGPPPEPAPLHLLPGPMARAASAIDAVIAAMEGSPRDASPHAVQGTGIGDAPYRGRARVVGDAATALATIDDGDVVVTSFTGPAWNSLLPMIGALVVEEGGPMSHAAIVARELGIPSVIGAAGATLRIPDGSEVEVDPTAGAVRVIAPGEGPA